MAKLEAFNFCCACALWLSAVSCLYSHAVSLRTTQIVLMAMRGILCKLTQTISDGTLKVLFFLHCSFANLGKVCSILTICVWLLCLAYPIKEKLYCRSKFSDREVLKLFSVRWLGVVKMMFKYSPWLKEKGWHVVHG